MQLVDLELVGGQQIRPESGNHAAIHPEHAPAHGALHVPVVMVGQVVDGGAMTQVHVLHHAEVAQRAQRSVHRGQMNVGMIQLQSLGEVLGADVGSGVLGERLQHEPTRRGDSLAPLAELVKELLGEVAGHVPSVGGHRCERFASVA